MSSRIFWFGFLVGVLGAYWYIYHSGPFRASVQGWFEETATDYKGENRRDAADGALQ